MMLSSVVALTIGPNPSKNHIDYYASPTVLFMEKTSGLKWAGDPTHTLTSLMCGSKVV
jgi:hypothetical protein